MASIICAVIAAAATIICACIAAETTKTEKKRQKLDEKAERRAAERMKEAHLQLAMIAANTELTEAIAISVKQGRCNGEIEKSLESVRNAKRAYQSFLEEIAIDHMN